MFAKFILLIWPLITIALFRRFRLQAAIIWSITAGYLLLPLETAFNFPLLPTINKDFIPAFSALVLATIMLRRQTGGADAVPVLPGWLPRSALARALFLLLFIGIFMTAQTNGSTLVYGDRVLTGLRLYDGFSTALNTAVLLLPLIVARKFLAHPDGHRTLLWCLCIAGCLYAIPALYEVRMSPQLNKIVYGFFPHQWLQHMRSDGFRPVVFLHHGLWLGLFLSMTAIAAVACLRLPALQQHRKFLIAATGLLLLTLVLAKTFGALMIACLIIPVLLFFGVRAQLGLAAMIALTVLSYPALRSANLIPLDRVFQIVEDIQPGRVSSLRYRVQNEDILLEKAVERPIFGWGGWRRNRVFDAQGRDISTTDGGWILLFGVGGWARYIGLIGLLALPIALLAARQRKLEIGLETSGLCLVLAANLADLIPNDTFTPMTWLVAGALLGRVELAQADLRASETGAVTSPSKSPRAFARPETPAALKGPTVYSRHPQTRKRATKPKD
jgi:hypothetical protein